ncbi:hypothetical protein AAFF_G00205820 [Aldrovandia affinis]|uniref:Proline and serine-rich protein 2 n=1 Tax=Aldrovandia affinis TaxID=143900 RepID=A0AAD7W682_9TELE|nr:hypothetical protein AAFF_G00205820 [Aldrovandia affinis]
MDFHVPSDPRLHFGLNGSQESPRRNSQHRRPFEDEALQFLSREEKECILFFEETIDSLDDDVEDPGLGLSSGSSTSVEGRSTAPSPVAAPVRSPSPVAAPIRSPSPKEQDIIDLVQSQPDLTEPREVPFNPPMPDFRSMVVNPDTHFEMKAKREPMENFPSEYHLSSPPLAPSAPSEDSFSYSLYQPAGSIPTPVLIAQKIAEHQGAGGPFSSPSFLSGRRRSLDSQSPPPDYPVKQGPPTMAKPTRYPDNINFMLGNRDINQTIAKASVNIHERRARMLANLTGGSLEQDELPERNTPTRSVSFRDPEPDKSRMEALSKLGLTQNRGLAGTRSRVFTPMAQSTAKPETSSSNTTIYESKPRSASTSLVPTTHTEVSTGRGLPNGPQHLWRQNQSNNTSVISGHKPEVNASDTHVPTVIPSPRPVAALPSVSPRSHSFRAELRPVESPRPSRQEGAQSSHGGMVTEGRRRSSSKPSFFHQGITVQFSGRGATDESRREALRKLGLLKDAP